MTVMEIIQLRAPQYATDPRIPMLTELAFEFVGDKIPEVTPRNFAVALQVLHWLTISDRAGDGSEAPLGAIVEEKEGELTVKYGNTGLNVMYHTSDLKAELGQTIWGKELIAFYKRYILPVATRFV
jgi:hypothetical protein